MASAINSISQQDDHPPPANLRQMMDQRPVPVLDQETVGLISLPGESASEQALIMLDAFKAAVAAEDAGALQSLFFAKQAYWKDILALTCHLRTFFTPKVIVANFLHTKKLRGITTRWKLEGATFIPATPALQFIDVSLSFTTTSPATTCSGRFLLLPVKNNKASLDWKIWIFNTKLDGLDSYPEDESLLQSPGRKLDGLDDIHMDVIIIGGGNAAVALAGRLKALGVDSVMAERNPRVGDNWALRYECMKFHIPTSFAELPFITYDKELQAPHLLTKDELAEQVRRFVSAFNLNVITSAQIQSTIYNQSTQRWTVKFQTPAGLRTAISKHLVQGTGIASQKPYIPPVADEHLYKGINIHSTAYRSAKDLSEQGVKSVIIIGSANTAFDVLQDCHDAGLKATMNVRSPTYIVPLDYVCHSSSLGAYNFGVEAADRMFLTLPATVDGQLARNLFAMWASKEPNRYAALAAAGFPVLDSADPSQALYSNLIEKAGGHYVDIGTTDLIAEGKAGIKAEVQPVAFTETGLRFSDDSTIDADAIVWCTGFADLNARNITAEILGGDVDVAEKDLLGPRDIAERLESTWGVDAEGEIRGMWKRHPRLENYWITGGYTQQHRWHSKTLALQIKAALEGILPPAYRDTLPGGTTIK
ncbi:hypothetical protein NCS57_01179800 [Fusarium keratoplasticum]|uniref:Uncharacterized protein n=1 Tax=Fusarium keratoplasticum TaxID=1328300 RepID=A0ACC0QKY9_9HYPO|nr:hypothetical protein NCS57_01179800 [Fusarium keratoplasticum]KAI8657995.1 hypothetical protein NCS57_01179800 [Fusarium keratoplasticum]